MATERRLTRLLPTPGTPRTFDLLPGHVAHGFVGDQFKTLLGSCVSVILTDPRRTVGTMCHIVHTGIPNQANLHNPAFGEAAMQDMFERLLSVGVPPGRCMAYVLGGGNMFAQTFSTTHIGEKNAHWVLDYLHHSGITVIGESLGGNAYRKVRWTVGGAEPEVDVVRPT